MMAALDSEKADKARITLDSILSDIRHLDASEFAGGEGAFLFAGPKGPQLPDAEELLTYWQEHYDALAPYLPLQQMDDPSTFPSNLWDITNNPATIVFLLFHLPALHAANDLTGLLTHHEGPDIDESLYAESPIAGATASIEAVISDFHSIEAMDVPKEEKERLLHRLATTPAAVRKQGTNYRDPKAFISAIVEHAEHYPVGMGQALVRYHMQTYTPVQHKSDRHILRHLACSKATKALKQDNFSVDQLRVIAAADPDLPTLATWALDAVPRIPSAQREQYRTFLRQMFTETRDDTRLATAAEKLKPLFAEHGGRMYKLFVYQYGESFYTGLEELVETVTSAGCSFATLHATVSFPVGTTRRREAVAGINAKVQQEADSIYRLFEQMYDLRSLPWAREATAREKAQLMVMEWWNETFQEKLNRDILHWLSEDKDATRGYRVSDEVEFPFDGFFQSVGDEYMKALAAAAVSHDDTYTSKMGDFLKRVREERWWPRSKRSVPIEDSDELDIADGIFRESYLFEDFQIELNRIRMGLEFPINFDDVRVEFSPTALDGIVNSTTECTSQGGRFEQYSHAQARDHQVGILGINLSVQGTYWDTVGKAFLFRMSDADKPSNREGNILYVDGVVLEETIADILALSVSPGEENPWMPLCTKSIILTALHDGFDDIIVTASYHSAQRTEWEYIRHVADLTGLREHEDFTSIRMQGRSSAKRQTIIKDGLTLFNAERHTHHLCRVVDESYLGKHVLEGFWVNHRMVKPPGSRTLGEAIYERLRTDPACNVGGANPEIYNDPFPWIPTVPDEVPQINDGNGYVIGIRRPVQEWRERFNAQYGDVYGKI